MEDSLRMNANALDRHGVELIREFNNAPLINIDKHKVLQILVNLQRDAKHACEASRRADKRLTVGVANGDEWVNISVIDNGVGIPPENLAQICNLRLHHSQGWPWIRPAQRHAGSEGNRRLVDGSQRRPRRGRHVHIEAAVPTTGAPTWIDWMQRKTTAFR